MPVDQMAMFATSGPIALFIDGANLHASAKTIGIEIDYKRLLIGFQSHATLLWAFYYTALIEDSEFSTLASPLGLARI